MLAAGVRFVDEPRMEPYGEVAVFLEAIVGIYSAPPPDDTRATQRCQPVGVSEILINQSSKPGETVADPFMGSGSVGVAALKSGRRFLGNDLNPEAVSLSATRLREFGEGTHPAGARENTPSDLIELMRPQP